MNAITEDQTLTQPEEGAPAPEIQEQVEEREEPRPEPEAPIRPLSQGRADLEKLLAGLGLALQRMPGPKAALIG